MSVEGLTPAQVVACWDTTKTGVLVACHGCLLSVTRLGQKLKPNRGMAERAKLAKVTFLVTFLHFWLHF